VADGGGVTGEPDEGVLAVSTAHQPPAPYPQKKKKTLQLRGTSRRSWCPWRRAKNLADEKARFILAFFFGSKVLSFFLY
jgi:hypothetical protein